MEKKKLAKVFMTPQRIKEVKAEVASLERMLRGADSGSDIGYYDHAAKHIQNPQDVQREIRKKKKMLADHTPTKLTGPKANKLYKWAKNYEKWRKEHTISNKEVMQGYPKSDSKSADFDNAVNALCAEMANPKIQEYDMMYKDIH